ncbi:hypothetical protein [Lysobacter sp. 22409]|uniref:hypothetical protein n=1 Tax=Lysobacter sp. 22409 TaxID=3453917 RepID=UPI003F85A2BE
MSAKAADIAPVSTEMPAVKVACRPISLPVVAADATLEQLSENAGKVAALLDLERKNWHKAARMAKVTGAGNLYLNLSMPTEDTQGAVSEGQMCAVVTGGDDPAPGLVVREQEQQPGFAGYCVDADPEACMEKVFAALQFSVKNPWPRLPIYSRWVKSTPPPTTSDEVIGYLSTTHLELVDPPDEEGDWRERQFNGVTACGDAGCPAVVGTVDSIESEGIAWFLRLSAEEMPKPSSPLNNTGASK